MVDVERVRRAFRSILLQVPELPKARAWENRSFSAAEHEEWVRETLLPITESQPSTNLVQYEAFIQYDVAVRANSGSERCQEIAKAVAEAFRPSSQFQEAGVEIQVIRTERSVAVTDPPWYIVPVSIRFRTFADN